ncbi:MAG: ATP-dependent helicase rep [Herbinix sp.]|jgi:DNA helicase-2/ATP-dependent DNA helicase PcrA|nr:ATP-dependent helicase rep [Herbinix sp.]
MQKQNIIEEQNIRIEQVNTNVEVPIQERQKEEKHLEKCVKIIKQNIEDYLQKYKEVNEETKELYDNYRSNNPELHNDLVIGLDMKSKMERTLDKNLLALKKPYFGRIDYKEVDDKENYSLYLGKNGIRKNTSENMIIDWRAPISSVYYDSDIGESSYQTPFGDRIDILLNLKRTYEISESKLIDYYDSDVIANDEFLTKYLSKNKEVVLGEIIATIQKEQNEIIRDTPWHSVIVQGVAGSGKTTVAMHRISYILYNYKEKFRPDEFFIIGSNKMLLNYITGVLPNLDVYNVNQMTMEEFLLSLLDKDFDLKKGKYTLGNSFLKLRPVTQSKEATQLKRFKGSIHFIKALMVYMKQYEINTVFTESVQYDHKVLYSKDEILYFLNFFEDKPLQEKIDLLNKRLTYKVASINEEDLKRKEEIKTEVNKYKNYFGNRNKKFNLMEVYIDFLGDMMNNRQRYLDNKIPVPGGDVINYLLQELQQKKIDLYDLGMLTYIKRRLKMTKDFDYVNHIVIDEAQDFGVMLFHLFKQLFKTCTYTIMGDVSQNIYYDTGMNDWEALKQEVFLPEKDRFYVLAKSYRNTVEISDFASNVLKKCSFKTYDIEPIIRHGKEVTATKAADEQQMVTDAVEMIQEVQKAGYDTIAIICRTVEETLKVKDLLKAYIAIEHLEDDIETITFTNGVMVLPIHMTKGLEFDAVVLWNPDEDSYHSSDEDAKLLYVAITRALHELHIIYQGELSGLLQ